MSDLLLTLVSWAMFLTAVGCIVVAFILIIRSWLGR